MNIKTQLTNKRRRLVRLQSAMHKTAGRNECPGLIYSPLDPCITNIYKKLQVQSQTGAVAKGLRSGII